MEQPPPSENAAPPGTPPSGTDSAGAAGPAPAKAAFGETMSRTRDNLDLLKAFFLGVLLTAVIYEVFPLPFVDERRVTMIFDNWISEVIVAMTLWSLFILAFKYRVHRRHNAALLGFLSPQVAELMRDGVNARTAEPVLAGLRRILAGLKVRRYEESSIFRRVFRVLHYIRAVPKQEGINDLLDYQAQIDVKKLDASYSVLHVFIWAIPILGFIGTVMGIAEAVREFSGFIQTAGGGVQFSTHMRSALAGVTSGLGIAFNTTFLALVLVIPVMLATSFLQKNEEELLLAIEEFCLEELLPCLNFVPAYDPIEESFDEHLHRLQQLSATWLGQFEPLIKSLSLQVDMVRHQMTGIQPLIKEFTDRLMRLPPDGPDEEHGVSRDPGPGERR